MRKRSSAIAFFNMLAALAVPAHVAATTIVDLGHPTLTPFLASNIANSPSDDRSVVFTALSTFSIDEAGIRIDPLQALASYTLAVDIYTSGISGGGGAPHGALLGTASATFSDVGLAFYDIPINFTFLAGQTYDVAFRSVAPLGWGNPGVYNMEFYNYNFSTPGGPYTAGQVSVLDGACHPTCGNYANFVMPHVRLDQTAVPEPASMLLLGTGLLGAGVRGWRHRRA